MQNDRATIEQESQLGGGADRATRPTGRSQPNGDRKKNVDVVGANNAGQVEQHRVPDRYRCRRCNGVGQEHRLHKQDQQLVFLRCLSCQPKAGNDSVEWKTRMPRGITTVDGFGVWLRELVVKADSNQTKEKVRTNVIRGERRDTGGNTAEKEKNRWHTHACVKCRREYEHQHNFQQAQHKQYENQCAYEDCAWYHRGRNPTGSRVYSRVLGSPGRGGKVSVVYTRTQYGMPMPVLPVLCPSADDSGAVRPAPSRPISSCVVGYNEGYEKPNNPVSPTASLAQLPVNPSYAAGSPGITREPSMDEALYEEVMAGMLKLGLDTSLSDEPVEIPSGASVGDETVEQAIVLTSEYETVAIQNANFVCLKKIKKNRISRILGSLRRRVTKVSRRVPEPVCLSPGGVEREQGRRQPMKQKALEGVSLVIELDADGLPIIDPATDNPTLKLVENSEAKPLQWGYYEGNRDFYQLDPAKSVTVEEEMLAFLRQHALYRKRNVLLQQELQQRAVRWMKENRKQWTEQEKLRAMVSTVALAMVPTREERQAITILHQPSEYVNIRLADDYARGKLQQATGWNKGMGPIFAGRKKALPGE